MNKKTAGIVTNIFSVLFWMEGIIVILMALSLFMGGMVPSSWLVEFLGAYAPGISSMTTGLLGLILIALGIFEIFIGKGLWMREEWARIAAVVLCIVALFSGWLGIVVGLVGIWFLGFARSVHLLFNPVRGNIVPAAPVRRKPAKKAKRKPAKRKTRKKAVKKRKAPKRKPAKRKKRK